jgi:hypothetical protein
VRLVVALLVGVLIATSDAATPGLEVVATDVARPLQLAVDGRVLVILGPAPRGDAAGEIHRLDLSGELPVDLSRQPRVKIPFLDGHLATLGSLAIDPASRQLFLGEENGRRIYRLSGDERLELYATGLRRLLGGSTLVFDRGGRLLLVDFADQLLTAPSEDRAPPGLEQFKDEDYRGPLVFRLMLEPDLRLPRRLDRLSPLYPRGWGSRRGGPVVPMLISVAETTSGDLLFLTSQGDLLRLGSDGALAPIARLPRGQYNRTSMIAAPDGGLLVSGGFHVSQIFRVSPAGVVTTVAANLADPQGIALDGGHLYIAESGRHRIIRTRL